MPFKIRDKVFEGATLCVGGEEIAKFDKIRIEQPLALSPLLENHDFVVIYAFLKEDDETCQ